MKDFEDDLDDSTVDGEVETSSGDHAPGELTLADIETNNASARSLRSARERLEQLRENRSLNRFIYDDLYQPEQALD